MAEGYDGDGSISPDNMQQMDEQEQGGYCIEIYVSADNQVQSVSVEQKDAEEAAEKEQSEDGMQVGDIKQALSLAMQIHQNKGQLPEGAQVQDDGQQEQDDLMEGYGNGNIRGNGSMPVRKVFRGNV